MRRQEHFGSDFYGSVVVVEVVAGGGGVEVTIDQRGSWLYIGRKDVCHICHCVEHRVGGGGGGGVQLCCIRFFGVVIAVAG